MPVGSGMDYQKKEKRGIMKRRLLFLLMLPLALGLWAQAGDYDQTYIIGRLAFQGEILQGTTPLMGFEPQGIAVQAFVTGVPLSDSTLPTWRGTADDGFYYYELPVINTTEADLSGEEIEVRLLLGDYALGLATGLIYTGTTTTYGSLTDPLLLNVVSPEVISPLQLAESMTVSLAKSVNYPDGSPILYNKEGKVIEFPTINWTIVSDNGSGYLSLNAETGELTTLKLTSDDTPVILQASFPGFPGCEQFLEVYVMASPVNGLTINETGGFPEVMYLGQTYPLTNEYVVFEPIYATDQTLTWSVSDPDLATIENDEESGAIVILPKKTGCITITATSNDNPDCFVSWTVQIESLIEYIELNNQSVTVEKGEQVILDTFVSGYYPENATQNELVWACDDESVGQVTFVDGKYVLTGVSVGYASVYVYAVANPEIRSYMGLQVIVAVESFKVLNPEQTVFVNDFIDLSYEVTPDEASSRYVGWQCSDPEAVGTKYDYETGDMRFVALKTGNFVITGTPDGKHIDSVMVHVVNHVETLTLTTEGPLSIGVGETMSLDGLVSFLPEDAYNKEVTWTTADASIATVSVEDGKWTLNGLAKGMTGLTVVSNDNPECNSRIMVEVVQHVEGVTVDSPTMALYPGYWAELIYAISPADATNQDVIWTSSDTTVVRTEFLEYEEYVEALKPGKATLTVTTIEGGFSATIEVSVLQPVTEIVLTEQHYSAYVGETIDLNRFVKEVLPLDAYNREVCWEVNSSRDEGVVSIAADGHTMTVLQDGSTMIDCYAADLQGARANLWITIGVAVETIRFEQHEQTISVGGEVNLHYSISPDDATEQGVEWFSSDSEAIGFDYSPKFEYGIRAQGLKPGKADVIVRTLDGGHTDTIHVTVIPPEMSYMSFDINNLDMLKGEHATFTLRGVPEYSVIDPEQLTFNFFAVNNWGDLMEQNNWNPLDIQITPLGDGSVQVDATAIAVGNYAMDARCGDVNTNTYVTMQIGQGIELEKGWNWVSMHLTETPVDGYDAISLAFDDKLKDARDVYDMLYNDSFHGLFGTLTRFNGGRHYHIDVTDDVLYANRGAFTMIRDSLTCLLDREWNWIWYPYDNNYTVKELRDAGAFAWASTGDRIVAKDDGFVEYDGKEWKGTLTELHENEGYLYYSVEGRSFNWPAAVKLGQRYGVPSAANVHRNSDETIWTYDHRRFADNMTIVARVDGLDFPVSCAVGAFVDGECRGQGRYVDGRFFITVHGQSGESISFILHDEQTGSWYTVVGSLSFDAMAGTLAEPVRLRRGEQTTAIHPSNAEVSVETPFYDLMGRRIVHPVSGVYISNNQKVLITDKK